MVIHHVYGFPQWLVNNDYMLTGELFGFPLYEWVQYSTELCVEIFAFMTGWSYWFAKEKDYKYSFRKLRDFFKIYWIHLIFFLVIAIASGYSFNSIELMKSLIAINNPNIILFGWYVNVYLFIMLTLPILIKLLHKNISYPILTLAIAHAMSYMINGLVGTLLHNYSYYAGVVILGYACNNYNILGKLNLYKNRFLSLISLFSVLSISGYLGINNFPSKLAIILVPLIIMNFNNLISDLRVIKYYEILGIHSLNIWFNHALFFSYYTSDYFQYLIYYPKNPVLVVIYTLLLGILISILVNFIQKHVFNKSLFTSLFFKVKLVFVRSNITNQGECKDVREKGRNAG